MMKHQVKDGWLIWEPDFFSKAESDVYFDHFLNHLPWKGGKIKVFGKVYDIPRKQVFFADDGLNYAYSGKTLDKSPWDYQVKNVKSKIERETDYAFNACLANLYRDGSDSNGWHADNESELGENPVIASLSFGETRKFHLRHNKTREKIDFELKHGSLLVMGGAMQHHWKHQVPKSKRITQPRVNLTFRKLIKSGV